MREARFHGLLKTPVCRHNLLIEILFDERLVCHGTILQLQGAQCAEYSAFADLLAKPFAPLALPLTH
jgi:hypothetical protein